MLSSPHDRRRDYHEEDHPRDDQGRWTDAGGGEDATSYEFVSPNVKDNLSLSEAADQLSSPQQDKLRAASADINSELKLKGTQLDVIGAWKDGAENSVMDAHAKTHWTDWDRIALAAVMKGHLADQKSVLVFQDKSAEKPRTSVTVKRPSGTTFQVEINPTASEIRSMAKESAYGVRVLIDADGNLYAWEADDAIHAQIASELDLDERYEDIWTVHKGRLISERYAGDYVEENFAEAVQEVRDRLASLHGDAALMSFEVKGDLEKIHQDLLKDGLAFHTLISHEYGATVYAVETDPKNVAATVAIVKQAAGRYDSKITYRKGRAEFIGDLSGTGSDREQRDRARGVYEDYIRRSPVYRSEDIWKGIHDKWGTAGEQAAKIFFQEVREYHEEDHPRDDAGRWTDAGGEKLDVTIITGAANNNAHLPTDEIGVAAKNVLELFPAVLPENIKFDGKKNDDFNCVAWAFGATNHFWWPYPQAGYHWPASEKIEGSPEAPVEIFDHLLKETLHGTETVDQTPEKGFVKLALFTTGSVEAGNLHSTHLARLMPDGNWSSKLGPSYLVRTGPNIHDMDYGHYGNVEKIYKVPEAEWKKLRAM
jgi:hypothetical protein